MKPLLLIDVDGVLNPYGSIIDPKGFKPHLLTPTDGTSSYRVLLNPQHGKWLLALADTFDLVWATTWQHDANRMIGPIIGLPDLPVIELPHWSSQEASAWTTWKMAGITNSPLTHGKPFAWIDDDIGFDAMDWRDTRINDGIPTHFEWINPSVGLTEKNLNHVKEWANGIG